MIRIVIENLLLFLTPTLIYSAYVLVRRRSEGSTAPILSDAPLLWLLAAGALMMVSTLIIFGSTTGWQPGEAYQPPVYKDGKVRPGQSVR